MRITLSLLLTAILLTQSVTGYSQTTKVSLHMTATSIKDVCKEIERKTDFIFVFSDDAGNAINKKVDIAVHAHDIHEVLDHVLHGSGLAYRTLDKQVVIYKEKSTTAQTGFTVNGKVVDQYGDPIAGVSIVLKGTRRGVTSAADGSFAIDLPNEDAGKLLEVYCVGHRTKDVTATAGNFLNVVLDDDIGMMDDLVVIGYGSKDKKSLTSAISSIKAEDVDRLSTTVPSVDALFGGLIKGVFSTQSSGAPGAGLNINVRGITSPIPKSSSYTQSNVPLYVIDGLPYFVETSDLNPLLAISPNDIESIDILKDASATAIYGSRGANGVIIIKTKNGRKGEKISIDAGYTYSMANPINEYKPLNVQEFKQLQDIIIRSSLDYVQRTKTNISSQLYNMLNYLGNIKAEYNPSTSEYKFIKYNGLRDSAFGNVYTNWVREVTHRNAAAHQYNLSLRGGSDKTNYSASINGLNQEGLIMKDNLSRYSIRLSVDSDISSRISAGATVSYTAAQRNSQVSEEGVVFGPTPWRVRPDIPVYDENGDFMRYDESALNDNETFISNPVATRSLKNRHTSQQFMGSGYLDVDIFDGLRARAEMNVSNFAFLSSYFSPSHASSIYGGSQLQAFINESTNQNTYTSVNARLDYNNTFGLHNIAAMAGVGSDRSYSESRQQEAQDFFNESVLYNIGSANLFINPQDGYVRGGLNSVYSRLSYKYDNRYLAELSFRGDVSSKFGPGNRLATFPAISLGWRIKNESFLKENPHVSDLKLRLSLGRTGSTNVEDFSYLQYYSKRGRYAGAAAAGLESTLPNRHIGWEITTEYNGGLDFAFFNNRLYGSLDVYNRFTKGALTSSPYVMESGMRSFSSNLIDMSNKGFEFEIGGDILRTPHFTWTSSFNISSNKNKVLKLHGASLAPHQSDVVIVGQPVGVLVGYKVKEIVNDQSTIDQLNAFIKEKTKNEPDETKRISVYQPDLVLGDYLMEDTDKDDHITTNDRVALGSPLPNFFGGWNNSLKYKNIELSFLMQFSQGGKAFFTDIATDLAATVASSTTRETFGKTWTPENTGALYPRMAALRYNTLNYRYNNRFIFSTSYLRMKNITLSYSLTEPVLKSLHLQSAMVFASITNLFTLTRWPGLDPEQLGLGLAVGRAREDPYPLSRTFSLGLRMQL